MNASLSVNLKPITPDDHAAAIALAPYPEQQQFIATNADSLAEASQNSACRPMLIRGGNDAIGFAMAALDSDDGNQWIYRFMIDHRFQAMGLGTKALDLVISQIFKETGCARIMLGVRPTNFAAIRLYRRADFRPAGFEFDGEVAFCLDRPVLLTS
ncbi:GNAT family N-acetyltransferase [Devosia riboflavina]